MFSSPLWKAAIPASLEEAEEEEMLKFFSMLVTVYQNHKAKVAQEEREKAIADRMFLWALKQKIERQYPGAVLHLERLSDREISDLARRIDEMLERSKQ